VGVAAVHPGAAPTTHHHHDTISHANARPVTPGSLLQRDATLNGPSRRDPSADNNFCQMPLRTSPSFAQMPNDLVGSQASLASSIGHNGHEARSLPRILPDKLNWIHRARFNLLLNAKDDGSDKDALALMHQQGRQGKGSRAGLRSSVSTPTLSSFKSLASCKSVDVLSELYERGGSTAFAPPLQRPSSSLRDYHGPTNFLPVFNAPAPSSLAIWPKRDGSLSLLGFDRLANSTCRF